MLYVPVIQLLYIRDTGGLVKECAEVFWAQCILILIFGTFGSSLKIAQCPNYQKLWLQNKIIDSKILLKTIFVYISKHKLAKPLSSNNKINYFLRKYAIADIFLFEYDIFPGLFILVSSF